MGYSNYKSERSVGFFCQKSFFEKWDVYVVFHFIFIHNSITYFYLIFRFLLFLYFFISTIFFQFFSEPFFRLNLKFINSWHFFVKFLPYFLFSFSILAHYYTPYFIILSNRKNCHLFYKIWKPFSECDLQLFIL